MYFAVHARSEQCEKEAEKDGDREPRDSDNERESDLEKVGFGSDEEDISTEVGQKRKVRCI